MNTEISKVIEENRPNISKNSVKTYASMLSNLLKKMNESLTILNQPEKVLEFIKKNYENPKGRKTLIASIVVYLGDSNKSNVDLYRKAMLDDIHEVNKQDKEQQYSEKQKSNVIKWDEVKEIYNNLTDSIKPLFKLLTLTPQQYDQLQNWFILSLYTLQDPRRSTDYTHMKLLNIDKEKDNYIEHNKTKSYFVFNTYKTKGTYGTQKIEITKPMKDALKKFLQFKKNQEYLLQDTKGNQLSSPQMTQRLNKIFNNKKISVSMLRHFKISDEVLKNVPALNHLEKVAQNMGHSVETQMIYKKTK